MTALAIAIPSAIGGSILLGIFVGLAINRGHGPENPFAPRCSLTPGESMRQHCEDEGATTGAGLRTKRPRRSLSLDDEDLAVAAAERWADERGGWKQ